MQRAPSATLVNWHGIRGVWPIGQRASSKDWPAPGSQDQSNEEKDTNQIICLVESLEEVHLTKSKPHKIIQKQDERVPGACTLNPKLGLGGVFQNCGMLLSSQYRPHYYYHYYHLTSFSYLYKYNGTFAT